MYAEFESCTVVYNLHRAIDFFQAPGKAGNFSEIGAEVPPADRGRLLSNEDCVRLWPAQK
jgi:hypothetical protein